ncbi:hypothetical protein CEXT_288211 [Caerostris extrusa]|uniref:Uncharacterized protein n=1 Tax=Caerostris extrusa TaxID=172846 RepID=A0AAV4MPP2_CAEEX|nr:hypothetical protein CEXT_288211 [Caerostris extrusa]
MNVEEEISPPHPVILPPEMVQLEYTLKILNLTGSKFKDKIVKYREIQPVDQELPSCLTAATSFIVQLWFKDTMSKRCTTSKAHLFRNVLWSDIEKAQLQTIVVFKDICLLEEYKKLKTSTSIESTFKDKGS